MDCNVLSVMLLELLLTRIMRKIAEPWDWELGWKAGTYLTGRWEILFKILSVSCPVIHILDRLLGLTASLQSFPSQSLCFEDFLAAGGMAVSCEVSVLVAGSLCSGWSHCPTFFKDLLRYPLAREGVTAPGGRVCLAHVMQRGSNIVGLRPYA